MKRLWITLTILAVIVTGIAVACSNEGHPAPQVDFESFQAVLLDYDYWENVKNPTVMGIGDDVTMVVARGSYVTPEVYPGEVSWTLSSEGVIKFFASAKSSVSGNGTSASGSIVGIKAVGEGTVSVTIQDAFGHTIVHNFRVGAGQHYRPGGEWDDHTQSGSDYYFPGNSSGYTFPGNSSGYTFPSKSSGYTFPSNSSGYTFPSKSSGYTFPSNSSGYTFASKSSGYTFPNIF